MSLTPIDVQQKTFGTALRGYDLDEVDDFLDEVVTSLKDYDQRLRDAQERIASLENELEGRGDAEGAIARALVAAQRSADSIVEEARGEARTILAEARSQATALGTERDEEQKRLQQEIHDMRAALESLRMGLRELTSKVEQDVEQMASAIDEAETSVSATTNEPGGDEFETPVYQGDIARYADRLSESEAASPGEGEQSEDADAWRQGGPRHAHEEDESGGRDDSDPWSFVDAGEDGSGVEPSGPDWRYDTGDLDEPIEVEEASPAVASDDDQAGARVPRPWEQS